MCIYTTVWSLIQNVKVQFWDIVQNVGVSARNNNNAQNFSKPASGFPAKLMRNHVAMISQCLTLVLWG